MIDDIYRQQRQLYTSRISLTGRYIITSLWAHNCN